MNWNPYPLIVTGLRLKETNLNVIKETLEGRSRERKGKKKWKEMEREWEAKDLLPNYNFGQEHKKTKQRQRFIFTCYTLEFCVYLYFWPFIIQSLTRFGFDWTEHRKRFRCNASHV